MNKLINFIFILLYFIFKEITRICVIAKITSQQGLENLDEILNAADGILLDRKGIEVEIGDKKLFLVEKIIISKCIKVSLL